MTVQQFQAALQKFKTYRQRRLSEARLRGAFRGEGLRWVAEGNFDKFESVEDAVEYARIYEELMSTEKGREKLKGYLGYHPREEFMDGAGI